MTHHEENSILEELLKELTLREPDGLRRTLQILLNTAMKAERDSVIKADQFERRESEASDP